MEATAGQIAVDEPPGMRHDGQSGNPITERNEEQRSAHFQNNNNNNNYNINNNNTTNDYAYDKLPSKRSDSSRFLFLNMNGLPRNASNVMNRSLLSSINQSDADVIGLAEHNCNFKSMPQQDQWHERSREWWETSKSTVATNQHDISNLPYLPGGTITVIRGKASHRAQPNSTPVDPMGLGRWSSILLRGSHGITLRVITAYRVCKHPNPGPNTAASQHHRHMLSKGDERHTRDAILEDLSTAIRAYHDAGEQIILMMDCNEDVRSQPIKDAMQAMGLREAITQDREDEAQSTHQNNRNGVPIDGIFISASLQILGGGYLPFGIFDSDHRAIWIDVTNANLFGFKIRDVPRHPARRMKCDLPRVKEKFKSDYKQLLRDTKLHQRIYHLQVLAQQSQWTEAMTIEFNAIMKIREKSILYADSRCRKLCMGQVSYSDTYADAIKRIELWKGLKKRKEGKRFSNTKIRTLSRQLGIESPHLCSLEEVNHNKDLAFINYYKVKKKADEHRDTFLEKKAKQQADANNTAYSTVLLQLRDREKLRKCNRRIDWMLEKHKGSGVTKISVEDHHGVSRDITNQIGIEQACMKEFEHKFRQTEDTPSMQEPWLSILGYDGKTQGADDILNGTLTFPAGTSAYTADFFRALRREPTISYPAPPATMETQSFQDGWKNMKERTSAGISGITFGHMKACAEDLELSNFEATINHIPYSTGFVPEAWKRGVCCMLPKKANSDKVTDLRTIVLQECEFNFNNKKIGKEAMQHAENNNFIAPEQYGGRKGKRSIDHVLNKRLSYDLLRFSRRPGAICSNDAKSCYDRVVHSIISIAFRRLGFPEPPIECMIQCIQQMNFFIRTTFGTSEDSFSSRHTAIPLQGLLQGNGAGPTIWVLVSTPLLNMLRMADKGAHLLSAISKERAHFVGFAFVDDTDLLTFRADDFNITADEIFDDMQESIDRWEEGLRITGGAIVPYKSWVYPISFEFLEDGRWKYVSLDDNDYQFSVKDHQGIRQVLQQFDVDIGKMTLGAILAPDGNNREAVTFLRQKSNTWYALMKAGHLQPDETFLATNSRIMKTLTYSLPAMTFTKKECEFILAPVLKASLSKSHVCHTFPRAVVFGPIEDMGLGYTDLYTSQGTSQLHAIVQYLHADQDITGQLLRHNFEAARVDIGLGGNFFMYEYSSFSNHFTDSWLKSVWAFVDHHNLSFSESVTDDHTLKREHDQFIMFKVIQLGRYTKRQLCRINACRLYLQSYSLSDISTGDGLRFTKEAWLCHRDSLRRTNIVWPYQPRPNAASRALWKQAIKLAFPRDDRKQFLHPLGQWTDSQSRLLCTWFFHQRSSAIYRRFGNDWKRYTRRNTRGQLGQFPSLIYECDSLGLPPESVRATVELHNGVFTLTGWAPDIDQVIMSSSLLDRYEISIERALLNMQTDCCYINCTALDIVDHLRRGDINLISDGSYQKEVQFSTAAWIIPIDRNTYKIGRHYVTGNPKDQCSHRGELSGILGGILDINSICLAHNIRQGKGIVHCDGLGAVSIATYIQYKLSPSHAHYDIINSLFRVIQQSPLQWEFHHVYGHQDDSISVHDLSDAAYFNTLADTHAKRKLKVALRLEHDTEDRPYILPFRLCTVGYHSLEDGLISIDSNFQSTLSKLIRSARIRQYWLKKGVYPPTSRTGFTRAILSKAMKGLSSNLRRWISKWCVGIFGNGATLYKWKQQNHSTCPRCQDEYEDALHCITCPCPFATALWSQLINEVLSWMISSHGQPLMSAIICSSLTAWRNNVPFEPYDTDEYATLGTAINDQHTIGWHRLLYGIWSHSWVQVQQQHFTDMGSKKSAVIWFSTLQQKLWMITFSLWEHRNKVLHTEHHSVHPQEMVAINSDIIQETNTGINNLPITQRYLFHGSVQEKLRWTVSMKLQWLSHVRRSRDRFFTQANLLLPARNETVTRVLHRWSSRGNVKL